jgi:hypothetical protein
MAQTINENMKETNNLLTLREAIKTGTYNVIVDEIIGAQNETLVIQLECSQEALDFIAFQELIQAHKARITELSAQRSGIIEFYIEEVKSQ